jgi:hypothetical protein
MLDRLPLDVSLQLHANLAPVDVSHIAQCSRATYAKWRPLVWRHIRLTRPYHIDQVIAAASPPRLDCTYRLDVHMDTHRLSLRQVAALMVLLRHARNLCVLSICGSVSALVTDDLLLALMDASPPLRHLHLENCQNVSPNVVMRCALQSPYLTTINVMGCVQLCRAQVATILRHAPCLRVFIACCQMWATGAMQGLDAALKDRPMVRLLVLHPL